MKQAFGLVDYLPSDVGLMPVRCYSCGKVIRQIAIEQALESGKPLKEVMDQLGYDRICCRQTLIGSPVVIDIQKKKANDQNIIQQLRAQPNNLVHQLGSSLRVIDQAPPGIVPTSSFVIPEFLTQPVDNSDQINKPFEYFMAQLNSEPNDE